MDRTPKNMDQLKNNYARQQMAISNQSRRLNERLFCTYNRIATRITGVPLTGHHLDLGAGDEGFSFVCRNHGIVSTPLDYPGFNLECGTLPFNPDQIDFVTMNAVIEHLSDPGNILTEIKRVLRPGGMLFIRTPNWQMDYKNFFNDPTHVKPYSPVTLTNVLKLFGFSVPFVEPGLIEKSGFWWKLPAGLKWRVAAWIAGGTKSIIAVGMK